jgi:hypothetical protein
MSPASAANTPNSIKPTAASLEIFSTCLHRNEPIQDSFGENYFRLPFFRFLITYYPGIESSVSKGAFHARRRKAACARKKILKE